MHSSDASVKHCPAARTTAQASGGSEDGSSRFVLLSIRKPNRASRGTRGTMALPQRVPPTSHAGVALSPVVGCHTTQEDATSATGKLAGHRFGYGKQLSHRLSSEQRSTLRHFIGPSPHGVRYVKGQRNSIGERNSCKRN